jgi:hypothetical protein
VASSQSNEVGARNRACASAAGVEASMTSYRERLAGRLRPTSERGLLQLGSAAHAKLIDWGVWFVPAALSLVRA